jgi:hypothetical protein
LLFAESLETVDEIVVQEHEEEDLSGAFGR